MKTLLLFFFLLNTFAFAAYSSGWSGSFKMTSSATSSGYSVGTVAWRWSEGDQANLQTRFEFSLKYQNPNNGFTSTELYQYNSNGGYQTTDSEYKYTDDTACNPSCSTSGISATYPAMPPMDPNLPTSGSVTGATSFWSTAPANPGSSAYTCQKFVPKTSSIVSSFTASRTSAGAITICGFVISDGCITRTYTLTSFSASVPTITPPAGCSCNSVLDIMLVIDHSSSITPIETRLFHQFVVNFLASLNVASNSVNVGIVWFHGGHSVNNGIQVGINGPTGDYNSVVVGVSNCTGSGTTIGSCATPSGSVPPWQTPCTPNTATTNECPSSSGYTCTSGGVLLGSSLLFSSSQNRKVPKLFITMTDGAVNTLVGNSVASTPWTSINQAVPCNGGSCAILSDSQNCTTELKTTMNTVRTQYNQWLSRVGCSASQCPLTFLSVGIGIPFFSYCDPNSPQTQPYTDPWAGYINWINANCKTINGQSVCDESSHCLSSQHLDILAGGNGAWGNVNPNVLSASDWVTLNNQFLPKLLALSCPDNAYTACACESSCAGFCSGACNSCNPPSGCTPSNNKCYQIVQSNTSTGSSCLQQTIPNVCPATTCNCNNCTSYTCDSTANGGLGACVAKVSAGTPCAPILQANGSASCVTSSCNVQTGVCDIINYNGCPVCQNATGACVGASCGVNGTQTTTLIAGVDYCRGLGNTTTVSCCAPCDCSVGAWTSWNSPCLPSGCGVAGAGTATRSRTITPATCGGSNTQCANVPLSDTQNCTDCTPVPCNYTYGSWTCNCSSSTATSPVIIITPPKNNGTACPVDNTTTCQCCADQWTSTACSCDTHTYSRTWSITVNASGPGATGCTVPNPTSYTGLVCSPTGCGNLTPICQTDADCNDFNACTQDICDTNNGATVAKHCRNVDNSSNCNTNSVCRTGSCDITLGCLVAPALNCDDDSVCTNDWCDDVLGCQHNASNVSTGCKAPTDCNTAFCDPFGGCQYGNIKCNSSATDNCTVAGCDPNWNNASYANNHLCKCSNPTGPCYTENVCGVPLALVVGLTAGGIAGVVVAAAICAFACVSGTTYAATQLVNSDDQVLTTANPLFQADGTTGVNAAR